MTKEEAINKVREMNLPKETKEILEALAPELRESEDERIRVRLIEYFKGFLEGYEDCYKDGGCVKWEGLDVKSILAWLEKQKEQKPVEYLSKDKVYAIMNKLTNLSYSNLIPFASEEYVKIHEITFDVRRLLDYPIEQKPAEWSEEDERMRQTAIEACKTVAEDYENSNARFYKCKDWLEYRLKSLRPVSKEFLQPHWKPSEEQMEALKKVTCNLVGTGTETDVYLIQLFEQLKKL